MANGAIVLCDRFYDSSLAYQGHGRGLDLTKVQKAIDLAIDGIKPNLTLLLDIPLSVSQARVSDRLQSTGEIQDQFDESGTKFFERVLDGFHILAKAEPARFQIINGDKSVDNVTEEIWSSVQSHL